MNKKCLIPVLLILLGVLFSCGDNNNSEPDIFETTLVMTDSLGNEKVLFTQGDSITFIIHMTNLTDDSQSMGFSSGQLYDIQVYDSEDSLIWNSAYDKAFIQAQTELVFSANETKNFEEIWNQETNAELSLDTGNYLNRGQANYTYSNGVLSV